MLLTWIFHTIFLNEAQSLATRQGIAWQSLTRSQQWTQAWTHGPGELWATLSAVSWLAFGASLLCMGIILLIGAIRWSLALKVQGLNLSFRRTCEISLIAHFFNSFLLGSTGGDLLKAYYAARETRHKKTEAVTTVFVDRLIGLFAMLLFAVLMLPLNLGLLTNHESLAALAGFTGIMLIACSGLVYLAFWGGISKRFPAVKLWLRRLPKAELLERSLEACRHYGRHKLFLGKSLGASMLLNLGCVLQVWILANGLEMQVPFQALLIVVPAIICVSAIPITPSGLGVRENLFVLMLAAPAVGASATHALSLSLLAYAGSLVWSLLGGVVYLGVKDSEHLDEFTSRQPAGTP